MAGNLSDEAQAYAQRLMRERRAEDLFESECSDVMVEQFEAELLSGVRSPHCPWEPGEFAKLAERLIGEHVGR